MFEYLVYFSICYFQLLQLKDQGKKKKKEHGWMWCILVLKNKLGVYIGQVNMCKID